MFKKRVVVQQQKLAPWKPYLFYDSQVRKIMESGIDRHDVALQEPQNLPLWDGESDAKNMLVIGGGGFGDKIQSTCAFRKLSERIGAPIDIAVDSDQAYLNLPYVANVMSWGVPLEILPNYDALCTFEDILGRENERTTHLADLFAERCFVAPLIPGEDGDPGEFRCDWVFSPDERRLIAFPEKDPDRLWVALQVESHGFSRSWPLENVIRLADMLAQCRSPKFTVCLIGTDGQGPHWGTPVFGLRHQLPDPPDGIINLCGHFPTWRQLAMFLGVCDLVIAPDSGPLHLAGVLCTPSVGLYGAHTYETRGKYFPTQRAIMTSSTDDRCPCHCHTDQQVGTIPCGQQYCQMMANITAEVVFEEVLKLLDETRQRSIEPEGDD